MNFDIFLDILTVVLITLNIVTNTVVIVVISRVIRLLNKLPETR